MPIIPRVEESQILNAGSPVPISGTGESRLMAGATDQLGEAMMKLGGKLASIEKAATAEKDKYEIITKKSQFETDLAVLQQEIESDDANLPLGPKGKLQLFQEEARKIAQQYAGTIPNERAQKEAFTANSEALIGDNAIKFYANAVKNYAKDATTGIDLAANTYGIEAGNLLDVEKAKERIQTINNVINSSEFLTSAEKNAKALDARKVITEGLFNGYVARMSTAGSIAERDMYAKRAMDLFTPKDVKIGEGKSAMDVKEPGFASTIFTAEEAAKKIEKLMDEKYKADGRQLQRANLYMVLDNKEVVRTQAKTFREYIELVRTAPKESMGAITEKMKMDVAKGVLKATDLDDIQKMGSGVRSNKNVDVERDNVYREEFFDKLMDSDDLSEMQMEPLLKSSEKKVSPLAAADLSDSVPKISGILSKDPAIKTRAKSALETLNSVTADPAYRFLPNESKRAVEMKTQEVRRRLKNTFFTNPEFDMDKAAKDAYKNEIKPLMNTLKAVTTIDIGKQGLMQKRDMLIQQYSKDKNSGNMSRSKEDDYKKQLMQIYMQLQNSGGE